MPCWRRSPNEAVNLSIFSIPDLSQIKDLAGVKSAKTGKIHILNGWRCSAPAGATPPRAKSTPSATSIRFSPTKSCAAAPPMPASIGISPARRCATWNSRWIAAACGWRRCSTGNQRPRATRRVGKGGPETSIDARRRVRRAHAVGICQGTLSQRGRGGTMVVTPRRSIGRLCLPNVPKPNY